jgi:hypothetical protein
VVAPRGVLDEQAGSTTAISMAMAMIFMTIPLLRLFTRSSSHVIYGAD